MKRVVIDTGVIISALLKKEGTSRRAFVLVVETCKPLVSLSCLSELEEVLSRQKFSAAFTKEDAMAVLELIVERSEVIEIYSSFTACRDHKDDKFLDLAIDGKADVILSRDPDLLDLNPFQNIPILSPADFIHWLGENEVPS